MTTLAKTEHIEIEQREANGHDYYILWIYEKGKLYGFDKFYDREKCFESAIKYVENNHVGRSKNAGNSTTTEIACSHGAQG
jgi:hypothetical protein